MTVLLDAFALLAVLRDEPAADEVEALLDTGAEISSLNAAEVLDKLCRAGAAETEADADLRGLGAEIVHPPADVVLAAGVLRARHYHHRHCPVSLADCLAAAHATHVGLPLATADGPLAAMVRAEGGEVVALSDSTGTRPD